MGLCYPKQKSNDKNRLLGDYDHGGVHCGQCHTEIKNNLYILQCGHHYHRKCILDNFKDNWKNHGYPQCPVCGKTHLQSFEHIKKLQELLGNK